MDNKRKGSDSPGTPAGSGRFDWDEPQPRDSFSLADDDDEGPLPAPPEFDVRRGGVPELLDGEEMIEEVEPVEDGDLLDSALVSEVRPIHSMPPPIPAPVPTGPSQRTFIDDGEIALPPRLSRHVQSFPFRQVRAEDDPAEEALDDEPSPASTGWNSPVVADDDDELAPEELEATEVAEVRPGLRFTDDDAPPPARAPQLTPVADDDDVPLYGARVEIPPLTRAPPPSATDPRWGSSDSLPGGTLQDDDDAPAPADMFGGQFGGQFGGEPEAAPLDREQPGRPDDTGMFGDLRAGSSTGSFSHDMMQGSPLASSSRNPMFGVRTDEEPDTSDTSGASADEPSGVFAARLLRDTAASLSGGTAQLPSDDDETSGWVHARAPQPSSAIPVANFGDDDDDDATWAAPAPTASAPTASRTIPPSSTLPRTLPPTSNSPNSLSSSVAASAAAQPSAPPRMLPGLAPVMTRDSETSGWIATRPGASMASGAIPVAEFADDEEWPEPPASPTPTSSPTSSPTLTPRASEPEPEPEPRSDTRSDQDDDDEWEPQTPAVGLAPVPNDLGEPFPLDLWSDPDELNGRDLGGFRLDRPLSRGMTSRVYLGVQTETGRRVAVRVLGPMHSPAEPRARQFLYEAQQLMKLHSDHIVEVLGVGHTSDHLSFYAMEYLVDGETLASALRNEGPMPWSDVAAFANQICDALILAGERGIIHNDLTAATCMRLPGPPRGEGERQRNLVKLLGVGVSPLTSVYRNSEGNWTLSQNTPPGAAEFMAPELAGGGRPDAHTAVYALGVLMYELTTGRPPFRGESFIAVLKKQMYDEPASPRHVVPEQEIPEVFEAVLQKALAKAPGDRYSDLRALNEALLAARAREGELRRVTQILALDPAFWDEDGGRRVQQANEAQSQVTPLSSFGSDRQRQPEHGPGYKSEPRTSREPSMALHLQQLAAPIVAPALPVARPVAVSGPVPIVVLAQPPVAAPSGSLFRNISLAIIIASLVVVAALWLSDRGRSANKTQEVAAETRRPAASKTRPRPSRDSKPREDAPVVLPPSDDSPPATVLAPPPEPEAQPAPPPEVVQAPPPEPEPEAKQPEPEAKQPEPEPEAKQPEAKQPEVATPKPAEDKPAPAKTTKPKVDPLDDRPDSITNGRLQAKLKSMEERVTARCRSKAGVPNTRGIGVTVRVQVDTRGEVKAKTTGDWSGTPMGQCIEEVLEAIRFNETRKGGGRTHTFKF